MTGADGDAAAGRADPDELLRRVQADEARARRGKLRVFFGFAPGVGKTYRMLQVARDLVIDHKLDVVVGVVETHRRADTAALLLGLDLLPRRKVAYRDHTLEEFDLDAALARRPQLILIDELAHTNAPGSRHPKRWQDVEELLDAGIDVFTTVNVQHVDSLSDVVAQITRVSVRETVPDSILDEADAIELVDLSPEELLQRLREGKVYLPDQARRAAEHFFQRGNLLALRELALRRTAQRVDDDVREFRQEHGVTEAWPAGERILVAVGPAPSSARLIRAAARMAAGLHCPWVAAHVEAPTSRGLSERDREQLDTHLRDAAGLGASIARLTGVTVADAVLSYARRHNVTRIVVGKPTHPRLRDRVRGSLLDSLVRGSADIDVHVIGGDAPTPTSARPAARVGAAEPGRSYLAAVAVVALATAVALGLRRLVDLPDPEMLFLLAVMVAATWFGRGPSLVAAALAVAAYDFFFVPPYLTFSVTDQRYVLTFAMMFATGLAISALAGRLRAQERFAVGREERTAALFALTQELSAAERAEEIAAAACRRAAEAFDAVAWVFAARPAAPELLACSQPQALLDARELGVVRWALDRGDAAGLGTDTLPGTPVLAVPLTVGSTRPGVLVLRPRAGRGPSVDGQHLLDLFARQVAGALARADLADRARASAVRAEAEELRSSLLSAVSHDLRTPLAAITGAGTTLRDAPDLPAASRDALLDDIVTEAARLERLVGNLLDMTRLESGTLVLRRDWVPVEELVGSALHRLEARLAGRAVTVALADPLELVLVDPVLLEQLLVNLLENADKHTPAGTAIELRSSQDDDHLELEVRDHGAGLAAGDEERVFEKFYRGANPASSGAGLGLAICRAIARAHGGELTARNHPGGGASFRLRLARTTPPPAAPDPPADLNGPT
jgi:two-component system sensor histidine kinase KdpD